MKIAVTYENGQVFQHFGRTRNFKLYTVEDNHVINREILEITGEGHGALAGILKAHGVNTLICGGIGEGARTALVNAGITLYPGVSGDADSRLAALLDGTLQYDPDTRCAGHGHGGHHHHYSNRNNNVENSLFIPVVYAAKE